MRFIILIILMMSVGSGLQAGEPQKDTRDVEDISIEELLSVEVTVASKAKETTADAPSSVSVFTREEIRRMGVDYLEELLNYVPGFQVSRDVEQGFAYRISARGRSTALSESILFLVDGQRINDLYTGGVSILNRMIAVENIKQVEIIRGPGSALYGSNAFLGLVNIVTRHDTNSIRVKAGNLDHKEISINIHKKVSPELLLSAFVKTFSDDGYHYENVTDLFGRTGETQDPVKGVDGYFTLKYKDFTVNARHMERDFRDFLTFGGLGNEVNRESSKQTVVSAAYKWKLNEKLTLDLGGGYLTDHWRSLAVLIPSGTEIAPGFVLEQTLMGGPDLKSYNVNFNIDLGFQAADNHWIAAGATYRRSGISRVRNMFSHHPITLDFQGEVVPFSGDTSFNEEKARDVIGLYVQNKLEIGKYLRVTAGIRLDRYSDFGSSINPRAAVIYTTPFDSKLKIMYGRAFRAPNFLELYDKNNPVDFGNPDLEPEKVDTIELAFIQNLKKMRTSLSLTWFRNKISNIIILGEPVVHVDNPLEAPTFLNAGKAETKGLELELKSTPLKNIVLSGTYTHLFEGDHPFVADDFASLALNYHGKRFNLNVNGIYRGEIDMRQDPYVIVNAALRINLKSGFSLLCSVKNIFDRRYLTVSQVLPGGIPARGLTAVLGLRYSDGPY